MTTWFERGFGFAVPVLIALVVSAVTLLLIGESPLDTFSLMVTEAFGSPRRIASTLSAATPLLFTAIATAVCFRAGVFNVGVDGAFLVAGLGAVVAGFSLPAELGWALIPICLAVAAVLGAAWLFIPGWLLARLEVDEVVSTLMLNFVAVAITGYLVNGPFLSEQSGNNVTPPVHEGAELARLMPPATLHSGFLIGLAVLVAYALWVRRTPAGLEGAWVGQNTRFARAVGVSVPRTIILAMVLSGRDRRPWRRGARAGATAPLHRRVLGRLRLYRHGGGASGPQLAHRHPAGRGPVRRACLGGDDDPAVFQHPARPREHYPGDRHDLCRGRTGPHHHPAEGQGMIEQVLAAGIVLTTPILLAAIGGLVNRQAGIVNIALEGKMLAGAFVAVIVSSATGSWLLATLAAALFSMVLGYAFSLSITRLGANMIIAGLGLNVLLAGAIGFVMSIAYGSSGTLRLPDVALLPRVLPEGVESVPLVGRCWPGSIP